MSQGEAPLADGVVGGEALLGDGVVGGDGHGQDARVGDDASRGGGTAVSADVGTDWETRGRTSASSLRAFIIHHHSRCPPLPPPASRETFRDFRQKKHPSSRVECFLICCYFLCTELK